MGEAAEELVGRPKACDTGSRRHLVGEPAGLVQPAVEPVAACVPRHRRRRGSHHVHGHRNVGLLDDSPAEAVLARKRASTDQFSGLSCRSRGLK